jgi:hypothetical protein
MNKSGRPTFAQHIGYIVGRTLPPEMSGWVLNDLTGPGAPRRYLLRFMVPVTLLLLLFLFIPGPLWMSLAMMALLFIPLVFFLVALLYVYRRHRLIQHGLDPALADANSQSDAEAQAYERRHGRG